MLGREAKLMAEVKNKSVILPLATWQMLKALADVEDRTISSFLRTKIAELHKRAKL